MNQSPAPHRTRELDHAGLEILTFDECMDLMKSAPVARVAFMEDREPMILPVNIGLWDGMIVFSTVRGSKLDAVLTVRSIAVEIDGWDADARSGWSVLARGLPMLITDGREIDSLDRLAVRSWVEVDKPKNWIGIRISSMTGRRTSSTEAASLHQRPPPASGVTD